jgi:hypothetical protein
VVMYNMNMVEEYSRPDGKTLQMLISLSGHKLVDKRDWSRLQNYPYRCVACGRGTVVAVNHKIEDHELSIQGYCLRCKTLNRQWVIAQYLFTKDEL